MKSCWILSEQLSADLSDRYKSLTDIAPVWGSWRTWQQYSNDNSICSNRDQAEMLIKRALQSVTNLYLPKSFFVELGSPRGVKLFDGNFPSEMPRIDDIVAVSICSEQYDLILMLGFEFDSEIYTDQIAAIIQGHPDCQFVAIDAGSVPDSLTNLTNFTCDTYQNVLVLL